MVVTAPWLLVAHTIQMFAVWAGMSLRRLSMPEPPLFFVQMFVPQPEVEKAANAARLNIPVEPAPLNCTGLAAPNEFSPRNTSRARESAFVMVVVRLVI